MKRFIVKILRMTLGQAIIPIFSEPLFKKKNSIGYYIGKVERINVKQGVNVNISTPFYLNDVSIGSYSYLSLNSSVTFTEIGKYCSIGPNFFCGWGIHPVNGLSTSPVFYARKNPLGMSYSQDNKIIERKKTIIGNDVFIGANVTVLDGITIGDGAIIGAGAVVSKDIPAYAIAVGSPIKILRSRFDDKTIRKLLILKWWDFPEEKIKDIERYFFDINKFLENEENKGFVEM